MRIALFHNLPSGGAKRTLMEMTRRLAARHHVDAYTLSCADHAFADIRPFVSAHRVFDFEPFPLLGSPFGRLNQAVRCLDLRRIDRLARRIASAIDGAGYDVVFVHPCQVEQGSSLLAHLARTPSVYYCHEPRRVLHEAMPSRPYDDEAIGRRRILNRLDPLPAVYRRALRRLERANTRSAGTVLANSRFMVGVLARVFGVEARVAYPGVDVDAFRPMPVEKRDIVLSVGSLTPLKGFDFLIRAMAAYPAARRPPLVIASNFQNPPERAYLDALAREQGVELALHGNVSDADLVRLYNEARVVACAPVREPFGLTPLEAMACGTPVVAVDEGGLAETIVHEQTGLLVPRDPTACANAIRRLMEDPATAQQYGAQGRLHVLDRWTWDSAVSAIEGLLAGAGTADRRADPAREPSVCGSAVPPGPQRLDTNTSRNPAYDRGADPARDPSTCGSAVPPGPQRLDTNTSRNPAYDRGADPARDPSTCGSADHPAVSRPA